MKIKKDNAIITPTKAHLTDAGFDIYSSFSFVVKKHSIFDRINLGVGFQIPEGYVGIISERSSQGAKGIHTIGNVVDYGYTGNVHVTLVNDSDKDYEVNVGDRICQLLVIKCLNEPLELVKDFENTERGENAHGSSGI